MQKITTILLCGFLMLASTKLQAQFKADFIIPSDTVCSNITDSLYNTTSGGSLPYTYLWDYSNTKISNAKDGYIIGFAAGTYKIKLRVTDAKGIKDSVTKTIKVLGLPKADYSATRPGCGPAVFNAHEDSSSLTKVTQFLWVGEGTPGFGPLYMNRDSGKYYYLKGGTYHYSLIVTGSNGCQANYTDSIRIATFPYITLPKDTSVCAGLTFVITARPINGTPPYRIWWDHRSDSITGAHFEPTIVKDTAFAVHVLDSIGCYNYDSIHIHAYPLPNAHWTMNYKVDSVEFKAKEQGLNDTSYTWFFFYDHNLKLIKQYGPVIGHIFPSDSIYSVMLIITDANGCSSEFDTTINVAKLGVAYFKPEDISYVVYPNPFNSSTTVQYKLNKQSDAEIGLYDIIGREIAILNNVIKAPGLYQVEINADKYHLIPGVYILKIVTDEGVVSRNISKL